MPHIMQFFKMVAMLMDRIWRQTIRIGVSAQNHLQRFLRELMPLYLYLDSLSGDPEPAKE